MEEISKVADTTQALTSNQLVPIDVKEQEFQKIMLQYIYVVIGNPQYQFII